MSRQNNKFEKSDDSPCTPVEGFEDRNTHGVIQGVPLATEPGISLIILPLMRILQRNLKRTYLTV